MWYKLSKMYIWSTQVRPSWWKPWANTVAYYPLTSTTTTSDESWNGYDLSDYWTTTTFVTKDGVSCAYMDGSTNLLYNSTLTDTFIWQTFTVSYWITDTNQWAVTAVVDNPYNWWGLYYEPWIAGGRLRWEFLNNWTPVRLMPNVTATSWWHHILMTHASDGSAAIFYDWEQKATGNCSLWFGGWQFTIWWVVSIPAYFVGYFSNVILENKARTAKEVSDYYNLTKWNYWIS